MYEFTTISVLSKPTDFKMCNGCNRPNWYENEECVHLDCTSEEFRDEGVVEYIESDYEFYRDDGYTDSEIDEILIET